MKHIRHAPAFKLRFQASEISRWAKDYSYRPSDRIAKEIGEEAQRRGHLTRKELLSIARWKTRRSQSRCRKNRDDFVREVTGAALRSGHDRFKIEVLRLLDGVEWPTASVILHFCEPNKYPILDYRALWSLGMNQQPAYDFTLWDRYVKFTRRTATKAKVGMRTLDRALWQYSKANQRRGGRKGGPR